MPIRDYIFNTGVETAALPDVTTPSADADLVNISYLLARKTTFTLVNNQVAAANVTGLVFDKTVYRSFEIRYQIYRSAAGGSTRAKRGSLIAVTDGTNWDITEGAAVILPTDTDAGVTFTITSAGQVQYTSDDNGGSYSAATSVLEYQIVSKMAV